ncbi:tyrosine-type recombinase/integrase [Chitinophaga sancti]|uniref:Tyrosine-type recombinase/integrase n=1 Tax=Chitinophaga sancti TaxID=1004 RepID=A0ABZ0XC29_9BACT|nr:tyrosine-type recombinase/integrase [Chitinophaga sancti]WQD59819.1 tyrosine-type recombinase/integrase [Chitinophaga sancti]WQG88050.1 tyrosine-type recombinase/integrase [Chitinophaga sancti]
MGNGIKRNSGIVCAKYPARHTFATTVCLKNGVPLETLQKLLGHADIRSAKVYIEVDEEKLEEDTSGVLEKLEKRKLYMSVKETIEEMAKVIVPI